MGLEFGLVVRLFRSSGVWGSDGHIHLCSLYVKDYDEGAMTSSIRTL